MKNKIQFSIIQDDGTKKVIHVGEPSTIVMTRKTSTVIKEKIIEWVLKILKLLKIEIR